MKLIEFGPECKIIDAENELESKVLNKLVYIAFEQNKEKIPLNRDIRAKVGLVNGEVVEVFFIDVTDAEKTND